ncbi:MAG: hypothetical protein HYY37_03500 [Candidatus Aenigmarchaeota archaeon]|nr:hypothetical protein [Candidatus Aenigmarchaeota archaeon]
MGTRECIPVSLPSGIARDIELLVQGGKFSSKSEALRFGAKLVVMLEKGSIGAVRKE